MEKTFERNESIIKELKSSAQTKAKIMTWLASSIVIGQFSVITLGTFHFYSWDIMEPVSYLMMLGNFTAGFGFYLTCRQDLAIESVQEILIRRMTRIAAQRKGIIISEHESMREEIIRIQKIISNLAED